MNNKETYIKRIKGFKYKSRDDYEKSNKTITFHVVICLAIFSMMFATLCIVMGVLNGMEIEGILGILFCVGTLDAVIFSLILGFYGNPHFGNDFDFFEELQERYRMRNKQYQPMLYSACSDLNDVIQLSDGKLFRSYQFINVEKSDINYIAVELPKNSKVISSDNTNQEERIRLKKMCMFTWLGELELIKILTPIRDYYRNKKVNAKIKKEQEFIKKQSEINATITDDEILDLPLYQTYKNLSKKAKEDVKCYNREKQEHLKNIKNIIS